MYKNDLISAAGLLKKMFPVVFLMAFILLTGCAENKSEKVKEPKKVEGFQPEKTATVSGDILSGTTSTTDFIKASKAVIPAVVHIKTVYARESRPSPNFFGLFDTDPRAQGYTMASGSGVVISADGYIATNNHVVESASEIEVIFPNRESYQAKLVGTDLNTDLALLKVDAKELSFVTFGNSDNAQIGEWVLAVGYPLSLNSTVTAGIISAKGRSIGIIGQPGRGRFPSPNSPTGNAAIESFIQTDAAINPGNSGGALVNTNGELIGINTAIASPTGSYSGYSFAVPVNLAKKVLEDLKTYGVVKRGILGVSFPSPSVEDIYLKQQGIDPGKVTGVYITGVQESSAADKAGLQEGDIIQSIGGNILTSSSEFSERIARHRPGDAILLTYLRDGKSNTVSVKLGAAQSDVAENESESLDKIYEKLGASFEPLSDKIKQRLNIQSGVIVSEIRRGGFFEQTGIPRGTIIVNINGVPINNPKEIEKVFLNSQKGTIRIMAIAPDGSRVIFSFSLGT